MAQYGDSAWWAHGYRGTGLELKVDNHPLRAFLVAQGYAWAASSFSRNAYDPAQGAKDTHALTRFFNGQVGKPIKTDITGASMGGHVSAVAAEPWPRSYDGAMPLCGVLGDTRGMVSWRWCFWGFLIGMVSLGAAAVPLVVGSKRFTESYILGEIVTQTLVEAGVAAEHKPGLGNTGILLQALKSGAVDLYPEYTGTIVREILQRGGNPSLAQLNEWLAPLGLKAAVPLGFNNTYALAMREARAQALGIRTIGDLARHPDLKLGLSHEFLQRADGWPALRKAYALPQAAGSGLDHGLAYEAVAAGQVDLIDIYSTDAKVGRYALRVLTDDRAFFPKYEAVLLMRAAVDAKPLQALAGRIDEAAMIALNAQVELDGQTFAEAARRWRAGGNAGGGATATAPRSFMARLFAPDLPRLTAQHLALVVGSVLLAVAVGVPMGIAGWRRPRLAAWLLGAVGVLQTVPSLALLAFLIAALGRIGFVPALLALFVYALLPVVRNTLTGLQGVPAGLQQAAVALGLTPPQVLRRVALPLAMPTLVAGVQTAAVINVGTATVAAFIGAGGFGERIVAGLAVNDNAAMLAGALPAAVLALAVQGLFALALKWSRKGPAP